MLARFTLTVLVALVSTVSAFSETSVVKLSEAREKLVLPEYTAEEKALLVEQADLLLRRLYVNRDLKIAQYGAAVDPLPRLDALKRDAEKLTSAELHQRLSRIFFDLHDLHTNYKAPAPLSCGLAFVPLRFWSVREEARPIVVVAQKLKIQAALAEGIELGDRLVEVNGESVERAIEKLAPLSGGANPDATRARAIEMLSLRAGAAQPLPAEDKVKLKLEGKNGTYEKEIPWMALLDEGCLEAAAVNDEAPLPKTWRLDLAEDEFQKQFNRVFGVERPLAPPARLTDAADPESPLSEVFEAALLDTPTGPLGYIRLKAFYWSKPSLDTGTVIEGLRRTIEKGFVDARGIVIDVRGNPGGLITFAEKLVQFFATGEVQPTSVRMLANKLNHEIFLRANGGENRWSESVQSALASGTRYAGPLSITPSREANDMGQIWFRPVVVLTDATCYSACDLFAAGMQDRGAGVVIGLHETTGAGGANVMEQSTFRAILAESEDNPFKALPHGQRMRVSWRQVIRTGKNEGKVIEGEGVRSDIVVPLRRGDVGKEPKELMQQIRRVIEELGPRYRAGLGPKLGGLVMLGNDDKAAWSESVWGVDTIELFAGGKRVGSVPIKASDEPVETKLLAEALKGAWRDEPVTLVGKRDGATVFRTVRELKWRGEYLPIPDEGIRSALESGKTDPFRTVLVHGAPSSGWQAVGGKLRVGAGPKYENNVHTRAFVPVRLDGKRAKFKFDLEVKAESPYDTLRIFVLNPDSGARLHAYAGSNFPAKKGVSFTLPAGWHRAEVVFEFESDENWVLEGPTIGNLEVTKVAAP